MAEPTQLPRDYPKSYHSFLFHNTIHLYYFTQLSVFTHTFFRICHIKGYAGYKSISHEAYPLINGLILRLC